MAIRSTHLHYFVAVAEEGQITRAAAKLHVAQPALSQAIASLESELGFAVFERHARGVNLTPAGETFLVKAREALGAEMDAAQTAQWLSRTANGTIEFGFVGAPPGLDSPGFLGRFSKAHPEIDVRYRELGFPGPSASAWLAEVDLVATHTPPADEEVWTQFVRTDPRVLLAPAGHPLAERSHLTVGDVLDETFIGYNPSVDMKWAGFWSLDDHRGGPPAHLTPDEASVPQEVLAALAVRSAVTTVPASSAAVLVNVLVGIAAVPLVDADPATFVLAGRSDRINPLVSSFREFSSQEGSREPQPADAERPGLGPSGSGA